jgi:hypothetical protein
MKIRELAAARSGDKGSTLDLTLVAFDDRCFELLERRLTTEVIDRWLHRSVDGPIIRYVLPGLRAIKFVLPEALEGGLYASLHAGLHWQKAAIWLLLDEELPADA